MHSNTPPAPSREGRKQPLSKKNTPWNSYDSVVKKKTRIKRCTQRPYTIITINSQLSTIN